MSTNQSTTIFEKSWSLYDLITEHNYMFHEELYIQVEALLKQRGRLRQYQLLDLGCGNARYLAPCLKRFPPALYEGVDLSEPALMEAREYLSDLPGQVVLTRGDLLKTVESTDKTWDVIFAGFAIHHLTPEEKARFFRAAGDCLSSEGWLILVDIVREENQDRQSFLDGYLQFMREKWTRIPKDQLEEACGHVRDHDYPESLSTLNRMARAAGFASARLICRYAQHHVLLFSSPPLFSHSGATSG
ncbi:MAG TPA: class I SAM-dependent methyltransferase [Nitrosospira sp.]|nr:class I SAM-dependent methyltransferase [Nitrosospira sp.]